MPEKTPEQLEKELQDSQQKIADLESQKEQSDASLSDIQAQLDASNTELEGFRDKGLTDDEATSKRLASLEVNLKDLQNKLSIEKTEKEKLAGTLTQKEQEHQVIISRMKITGEFPDVPQEYIVGKTEEELRGSATKFQDLLKERLEKAGAPAATLAGAPVPGAGNVPASGKPILEELTDKRKEAAEKGDVDGILNAALLGRNESLRAKQQEGKKEEGQT